MGCKTETKKLNIDSELYKTSHRKKILKATAYRTYREKKLKNRDSKQIKHRKKILKVRWYRTQDKIKKTKTVNRLK